MIFGELAEQSADYQTGHNTGTNRARIYRTRQTPGQLCMILGHC